MPTRLLAVASVWTGAIKAMHWQISATLMFSAGLVTICQQVAQALGDPLERISVEMVCRALDHDRRAVPRGAWDELVPFVVAQATLLGLVTRWRKQHRARQQRESIMWGDPYVEPGAPVCAPRGRAQNGDARPYKGVTLTRAHAASYLFILEEGAIASSCVRSLMYTAISRFVVVCLVMVGCTAPNYLSVAPADPVDQDRRLAPSRPEQAIVRDQHLGALQVELRFLEESLVRAEQKRLSACQQPEAAQVSSLAYHRCQFADQLYERLIDEAARSKERYLHAMSGSGGSSR